MNDTSTINASAADRDPGVKSVERTLRVLDFLGTQARDVSAQRIARACSIPRSSTYALLNSMVRLGFVSYIGESSTWTLGPRFVALADGIEQASARSHLARPLVDRLAMHIGRPVHAWSHTAGWVRNVALSRTPSGHRYCSAVGQEFPVAASAIGWHFIAAMHRRHVDVLLGEVPRHLQTRYLTVDDFHAAIQKACAHGVVSEGRIGPGLPAVAAAACRDHHGRPALVLAVELSGYEAVSESMSSMLETTADTLSIRLGGRPSMTT